MKVFLNPPQPSRGLQRIADALTRYAPQGVTITTTHAEADLVIIYAIGRRERIAGQTYHLLERGHKYAIIQVCLRSTMSPSAADWIVLWENAQVVWSYYDLDQACVDDGFVPSFEASIRHLHAPLGVDSSVFRDKFISPRWASMPHQGRNYTIVTSGLSRLSESVRECWLAAEQVDGQVFHLGPSRSVPKYVHLAPDCSDGELALHYASSQFVSGLRRKEGFELPAAEGLLCGARPVVFDTPDYRWNYKSWAEYIHEGTRQEVVDQLVQLFKQGARPVTEVEREEAAHWFNWERVCGEFWSRCL